MILKTNNNNNNNNNNKLYFKRVTQLVFTNFLIRACVVYMYRYILWW